MGGASGETFSPQPQRATRSKPEYKRTRISPKINLFFEKIGLSLHCGERKRKGRKLAGKEKDVESADWLGTTCGQDCQAIHNIYDIW